MLEFYIIKMLITQSMFRDDIKKSGKELFKKWKSIEDKKVSITF